MKRLFLRLSILSIGCVTFLLTGCDDKVKTLVYAGASKDFVPVKTIVTSLGQTSVFSKVVAPDIEVAVGGFQMQDTPFFGIIFRVDNMSDSDFYLNPADFLVKTSTNYKLNAITLDLYINTIIGNAVQDIKEARRPPVRRDFVVESLSPYGDKPTPVSRRNVTLREVKNPWNSSTQQIAVDQAKDNLSLMRQYAQELDLHYLRQPIKIEAKTWSYFYLFYELPQTYPIIVSYKGVTYPLSLPQ